MAEAEVGSGDIVDLRPATREEASARLLSAVESGRVSAIGLDLGFSYPGWFLDHLGVFGGPDLWALVAAEGEAWLAACGWPFWGRRGVPRPELPGPHLRRAELEVTAVNGIRPKSMFQVGGAGAVGTGSIRGMPLLLALHEAGARVWPFYDHDGGSTVVVEVWPRSCTGPVVKRRLENEHAHDAAATAAAMATRLVTPLPPARDTLDRREGRIWEPGSTVGAWRPAASAAPTTSPR